MLVHRIDQQREQSTDSSEISIVPCNTTKLQKERTQLDNLVLVRWYQTHRVTKFLSSFHNLQATLTDLAQWKQSNYPFARRYTL